MRIKVLMVGDDPVMLTADIQLLRDKNFLVYTSFDTDNLHSLIEEIHPDLLFINPQRPNGSLSDAYNTIVTNAELTVPVVYTLLEDDVYLVTQRSHTTGNRNIVTDNILSAIKLAFGHNENNSIKNGYIPAASRSKVALLHNRL